MSLDWLGSLADIGIGVGDYFLQQDMYNYQKDWNERLFEYNKQMQNTLFEREDNSVQRRVADLKKAGLSPLLASGSGAGAGSIVSQGYHGPTRSRKLDLNALNMLGVLANIDSTKKQTQYTDSQMYALDLQSAMNRLKWPLEKEAMETKNKAAAHNLQYAIDNNLPVDSAGTPLWQNINNTYGAFRTALENTGSPQVLDAVMEGARQIITGNADWKNIAQIIMDVPWAAELYSMLGGDDWYTK